ncbi:MAG: hypothetical protein V4459_01275 [Pseudomonadota bacterium]
MAAKFETWEDVVAFALTLPDTVMESFYGTPCPKVNQKAFVSPSHEAETSFHVPSPHAEKAVLLDTDPDTFWQTPHYASYPGLLVRYGADDPERIATVIRRAWWDRAKKPQREAFGDRP